jgi:hypothetical protein
MSFRQKLKDFFNSTSPLPIHGFVSRIVAEALAKASNNDELKRELIKRIMQSITTAPLELRVEFVALLGDFLKEIIY